MMQMPQKSLEHVLVIGGGAIGCALAEQLTQTGAKVTLASRQTPQLENIKTTQVKDWSEQSLETLAATFETLSGVVVATGLLHDAENGITPEKALGDLTSATMAQVLQANTIFPALCGKVFLPKLDKNAPSFFAALSARVGSISDNQLGGWYSYRMSKAALNMFIKTASIEVARKNKTAVVFGLHPGTVESQLSAPFQRNVPAGKLFTPAYSAAAMAEVILTRTPEHTGRCFDYAGEEVLP